MLNILSFDDNDIERFSQILELAEEYSKLADEIEIVIKEVEEGQRVSTNLFEQLRNEINKARALKRNTNTIDEF